jgi:cytochrome c biogenesis protein CcmG, thiol:disulfide interchange protein DsbE
MLHSSKLDDGHAEGRIAARTALERRRPILIGLVVATLAALVVVAVVRVASPTRSAPAGIHVGQTAPDITGTTLDGKPFRLADLRGRPVIVNFWGPSCIPCRSEFPLFRSKLAQHAADGLQVVGVLMYDTPTEAQAFVAQFGATWPTVVDPDGRFRTAYQAVARPQTYFIDANGVLRTIQIGEVVAAEFERQFATIAK